MKKLLTGLILFPIACFAGEPINTQISVPKNGKVVIENQRGDVVIKSWDKSEFKVTGTLDDIATGYTLENSGSITEFIVEMPKRYKGWNKGDGSDLIIYMPKDSELSFKGVNVDISASELLAGARIKTVNGDITATKLEGKVSLETVNGDVNAKLLSGDLRFETVNGDINDMDSKGELRFNAVNGDIESDTEATDIRLENVNGEVDFTVGSLRDLRLNTVNGEITVKIKQMQNSARINMDTVSGDVRLYFPSDVSARFDIDAHSGGRIINELSSDKVKKAKYGPSRELNFSLNGGEADVEIDTVSGRIELKKN